MSLDPKISQEYELVKKTGGLIDFSFREKIRVSGKDRISFLHRMLTNDIQSLIPGKGTYACLLNPQAKVIGDMFVFVFQDHVILDMMPGLSEKNIELLSKFIITDDVNLENVTQSLCDLVIFGPKGESLMNDLGIVNLPKEHMSNREITIRHSRESGNLDPRLKHMRLCRSAAPLHSGMTCIAIHLEIFETRGWAIFSAKENEQRLLAALKTSGFELISPETVNILRMESGMPFHGIDFDENTIILEAGLEHAISFTKGCYPGQEIVARMDSRSKVAKKLKQILISGNEIPNTGEKITKDGKEIGKITSAAFSPKFGRPVAFGYIARDFLNETEVQVGSQNGRVL